METILKLTASTVAADPSAYGFTFNTGSLHKGKGPDKMALPAQPLLTVTDVALFDSHFPGVILAHADGQSIKVHAQRIARDMAMADHGVAEDAVKMAEIESICFGRVASRGGATTKTVTVEVPMTTAQQAQCLAEFVELGMTMEDARETLARIVNAK